MQVVVNGLMTNYLKAGQGRKVVVLLHGWGDSATTFSGLAKKLEGYTVLVPDLPGFGGTEMPPKAWGVDEYANFVTAWLKKIGQKEVYAIIGHSNGGAISIGLLASDKLKAGKLILLASSGIRDIYKMRRMLLKGSAKIAKLPLKLIPSGARQKIKGRAYRTIGSDSMLLPEMEPSYRRMILKDMQADATKIKSPTLLIYGRDDKVTPVKYGQLFAEAIPNSKLEIVDGAGHMLHQEANLEVSKLIEDFLGAKRHR